MLKEMWIVLMIKATLLSKTSVRARLMELVVRCVCFWESHEANVSVTLNTKAVLCLGSGQIYSHSHCNACSAKAQFTSRNCCHIPTYVHEI